MRERPLVVLGLLAALALGAALLVGSGILGGARGDEESYLAIRDLDDVFAPEIVRFGVGTEVEWRNTGRDAHTVTADGDSFRRRDHHLHRGRGPRDRRAGSPASRTT